MKYPKPIMSITELHDLGFSRIFLNQMVHRPGANKYAFKTMGGGKWLIDTEEFEKARKQIYHL